jgi:phage terminase large subunit
VASKQDRINAARTVMPYCHFNRTYCSEGLRALRSWSFAWDDERKTFSKEPLHDWASHGGDGYSYGAQVMRERALPKKPPAPKGPKPWTFDWVVQQGNPRRSTYRMD